MKVHQLSFVFMVFVWGQGTLAQDSIPLSLGNALELAQEKNIDVNIALGQVNASGFALREAKGNFLPKLSLNASYNRNIDRQVIFLPEPFGTGGPTKLGFDNDYSSSLNLSLPVYSNFNFANKRLSRTRYDLQKEIARGIRHSVENNTKKAYFNYAIAQEIVRVQQERLNNAEETVGDIRKRVEQGTLTDYDLTSAKVQVATAKNNLLEAQSNIIPLANTLKLLLGLDEEVILKLTEPIALTEPEIPLREAHGQTLENNSQLKQLELDIELKKDQIDVTKSAYFPTLTAIGNYNYVAQADDFKVADYDWVQTSLVGLQLRFDIFNGTVTKNKVAQAKINKEIAEEQKDFTTKEYRMRHGELLSQLRLSREKVAVQQENMALTEEALALSKKRYELGVGTLLEVNDAELSHTAARLNWLQAISNYKSAYYDYQLLIGGK
ncbi:TolC family protein [Flagellimonas baculiformis]|uniref:TolC family protein n=1 Tax=Flagellimonas baculiformis TaxID=3067310 RepID=UPI00296F68C9|nr:TolC family protein [Muricauda sp. D6]